MDMLPNMIVERLMARQAAVTTSPQPPMSERPAEIRPTPEFRSMARMSPPRRRRHLVTQSSVPTPSTLTPYASFSRTIPGTSTSLPASPSDAEQDNHT